MIELGQKVKHKLTGFTGTAIARIVYLNGCEQILVLPKMSTPKKGDNLEYPNSVYIDIEELDVVGKAKAKLNTRAKPSGGIRNHPC